MGQGSEGWLHAVQPGCSHPHPCPCYMAVKLSVTILGKVHIPRHHGGTAAPTLLAHGRENGMEKHQRPGAHGVT